MTGDERGLMDRADDHHRTCGHREYRENQSPLDSHSQYGGADGIDDGVRGGGGLGWHPLRRLRHHRQYRRVVAQGTWACVSAARWGSVYWVAGRKVMGVDWRPQNRGWTQHSCVWHHDRHCRG